MFPVEAINGIRYEAYGSWILGSRGSYLPPPQDPKFSKDASSKGSIASDPKILNSIYWGRMKIHCSESTEASCNWLGKPFKEE